MHPDTPGTLLGAADELGHESLAGRGHHAALKLRLRLLSRSTRIEDQIRRRLRARFGISLQRFDYMAQLHCQPEGLKA